MTRADTAARHPFLGRWRITEMELWTAKDLDLLGPAHLMLDRNGSGEMSFVAIEAGLDYRVGLRGGQPAMEFRFDGSDEGDPISGRGWAVLENDALHGRLFVHNGDESGLAARRDPNVGAACPQATMKQTPALGRLEKKLAADPCAILDTAEVRLLDREVRRALIASFPGVDAHLDRSEDTIRWHALGARCAETRGARGIREVSMALGIPQYRLRAIERGYIREIRPDLARRYFQFLGIATWVARWCRANRELASRVGLLDETPQRRRTQRTPEGRRGT